MIFIVSHDFYSIFSKIKIPKNSDGIFGQKYLKKIIFIFLRVAIILRSLVAGRRPKWPVSFTVYTIVIPEDPPNGGADYYRVGYAVPTNATLSVGLCGIPKRYSIVRERKRRAGSGHLGGPAILVLLTSCAPFPPLTYQRRYTCRGLSPRYIFSITHTSQHTK